MNMGTRKAKKSKTPTPYPIPPEAIEAFRERKKEKGVVLYRSIADALDFALRNRQAWW